MKEIEDLETIISCKELIENRDRILKNSKKKIKRYKLKRWVKNVLWFIFGLIIGVAISFGV